MDNSPSGSLERYAAIGGICAAWAHLEMTLLFCLATLFNMDEDEAAVAFGSLDMNPRLTKAVVAARHFRAPAKIILELEGLRSSVREKTAERRNQAVHAVRLESKEPDASLFIMHRWPKERREQNVSADELRSLYSDIIQQVGVCSLILAELARWSDSKHRSK